MADGASVTSEHVRVPCLLRQPRWLAPTLGTRSPAKNVSPQAGPGPRGTRDHRSRSEEEEARLSGGAIRPPESGMRRRGGGL